MVFDQNPDGGPGNVFRKNILYQDVSSFSLGEGFVTVRIMHYGSMDEFTSFGSEYEFDSNCYYNPNRAILIDFFATSGGGVYTLPEFQGAHGQDMNSVETDPLFLDLGAGDYRVEAGSPCAGMGAHAGR